MAEVLSEDEQAQLRERLEDERLRLRAEIREELLRNEEEQPASLRGQVHDSGEEAVADLVSEVNTAVISTLIRELREVEEAQRRQAEGGYGLCEDCGEPIGLERLRVQPAARRCLHDQERFESK